MSEEFTKSDNLDAFYVCLGKLEKIPQKCVDKAAAKGANIVRRETRTDAPVDSGDMKRGIIRKSERHSAKGKRVYEITMDRSMNDVFAKVSKAGKRAYYPSSQEYGFLTRSKGGGLSYVPGYHFMRKAAESNEAVAKTAMFETLNDEIEKEWNK